MKNGGRNGTKNGGRKCMKNGGRKCIRNGVIKRRVGLALSDTLSTPTGGQKNGEKIKPKNGENFGTKTGKIFVPAYAWHFTVIIGPTVTVSVRVKPERVRAAQWSGCRCGQSGPARDSARPSRTELRNRGPPPDVTGGRPRAWFHPGNCAPNFQAPQADSLALTQLASPRAGAAFESESWH